MKSILTTTAVFLSCLACGSPVRITYSDDRLSQPAAYQAWYDDMKNNVYITTSSERTTEDLLDNRVVYEKDTKTLYMNSDDAEALLDSNTPDSAYTKISFQNAIRTTVSEMLDSGPSLDNLRSNVTNSLSLGYSTEIGVTLAYTYGYTLLMTFAFAVENDLGFSVSAGTTVSCDAGPGEFVQLGIQMEVQSWNSVEVCGLEIESKGFLSAKYIEKVQNCELVTLEAGFKQSPTCLTTRKATNDAALAQ